MTASDSATAYWYRKASGGGDPQSAFRLALRYGAGTGVIQNEVEATNLMRKAAEGNVDDAWPLLAERYEQGRGVEKSEDEAAQWFSKAAQLDHPGDGAVSPRMTVSASNGLKRPQPKDPKKPRRRWPSAADLE